MTGKDVPHRISIIGTSCSGKTTFAKKLAGILHVPHIELDALFWGPNWSTSPKEQFREKTQQALAQDKWIADGNYSIVRDIVWGKATMVIWLNLPFRTVFKRGIFRTAKRVYTKEKLFSGNVEDLRNAIFSFESIPVWILKTYRRTQKTYPVYLKEPQYGHLKVIEVHSQKEADILLDTFE